MRSQIGPCRSASTQVSEPCELERAVLDRALALRTRIDSGWPARVRGHLVMLQCRRSPRNPAYCYESRHLDCYERAIFRWFLSRGDEYEQLFFGQRWSGSFGYRGIVVIENGEVGPMCGWPHRYYSDPRNRE